MPMTISDGISGWLDSLSYQVVANQDKLLDDAIMLLYEDIQYAFDSGGPDWKDLSPITIMKKILEGAPNPTKILHEWWNMRNSIEIRDETKMLIKPVKRKVEREEFFGRLGDWKGKMETVGYTANTEYWKSVGIFDDTARKYTPDQLRGFRGARDPVSRGMIHEFGGFETQTLEADDEVPGRLPGEVIRTGRMRKRALKGESEAADMDKEIKKQRIGKYEKGKTEKSIKKRVVYIPRRSFLRDPFDRSKEAMFRLIQQKFGELLDNA